jgi:hypothetical protein
MGARTDSQKGPLSSRSINETAEDVAHRELRIYRADGALSMIYVIAFGSDAKAIVEARKIAHCGYQVDVLRDGVRIDRISRLDVLGKSED